VADKPGERHSGAHGDPGQRVSDATLRERRSRITPVPGFDMALVLSGGGARAAYQVGVLSAIAERVPRPRFAILTGVSAGAINAVYLAAHAGDFPGAVQGLREEWKRLTVDQVYRLHPPGIARAAGRFLSRLFLSGSSEEGKVRGLLDLRPLRAFLSRAVDFELIQTAIDHGDLRALALSATSYSSGSTVTFVHGAPGMPTWQRAQRIAVSTKIQLDHVMASSAIPLVFPAVKLDNGFYGDGSVRQTAPLAPAIHLGARRILLIGMRAAPRSIRRGQPADQYPTTAEVLGLLFHSIFLDAMDADVERLERFNRIIEALPPGVAPPGGLRKVDLLLVKPSRDLAAMAQDFRRHAPPAVQLIVRPLGGWRGGSSDLLSYLLFEPAFTGALMELGYADTVAQWERVEPFLEGR